MLRLYEVELSALAERIAEAEREARNLAGPVGGREERYTEQLRAQIHQKLNGFSEGALTCKVFTHSTDRSREQLTGADLAIGVDFSLNGVRAQKGVLVQAKENKNKRYGVTVDSLPRLKRQCVTMRSHTKESFVFAYGEQATRVLPTLPIITGATPSRIHAITISEFFQQLFLCWRGDEDIQVASQRQLATAVEEMEARSGLFLKVRSRKAT